MSLVALGPLIQVCGRVASRTATPSGTAATICPASTIGQLGQLKAGHVAKQPQRPVPDPQQPQRVARWMVGDPMRVVSPHVFDAEHVDHELRQLVRPARHRRRPLSQIGVPGIGRDLSVLMPDRCGA